MSPRAPLLARVSACPLCQQAAPLQFARHGHGIYACSACGHWFTPAPPVDQHVAQVYHDDYFQGGGAGYANYLDEAPLLRQRGRYYARLMARFTRAGRVLDVGAAAGCLLQGWQDEQWSGVGLEPNASMAAYGRQQFRLDLRTGTLEGFEAREQFQVVSFVQVLPHLVDLSGALARAAEVTAPGGYWLIETWNRRSLAARLWGRRWHEFSPPSVLHWFTPDAVARLAAQFGFVEVARGRPDRRIQLGHAKSLLAHVLGPGLLSGAVRAPLRLLPDHWALPYPGDDLFWIVLARRPSP